MPNSAESYTLWGISLVIAVAVLAVVVIMLTMILTTAKHIDDGAKQIWVEGKNTANSTIQLALLRRTNQLVADILEAANGILHHAGRIAQHAQVCAGCPKCVTAHVGAPPYRVQSPVTYRTDAGSPGGDTP